MVCKEDKWRTTWKPRSTSSVGNKIPIYEHEVVKRTHDIVQLDFTQHYSNVKKKTHTTSPELHTGQTILSLPMKMLTPTCCNSGEVYLTKILPVPIILSFFKCMCTVSTYMHIYTMCIFRVYLIKNYLPSYSFYRTSQSLLWLREHYEHLFI